MTDTPQDTPQDHPSPANDVAGATTTEESSQEETDGADGSEGKKPWWKIWG